MQDVPANVKVGVTIIVATTAVLPALVAVNEAMLPVPLAARPIVGLLFVQEYEAVPEEFTVEKVIADTVELWQTTWSAG